MARPQKEGLDYFSVDCQLDQDTRLVVLEYGAKALGVWLALHMEIHGENGYYIRWNNDVILEFCHKYGVGSNFVKEVVSACLRRGIFHRQLFEEHQILTSEKIQFECANATERRISKKIDGRYLLIPIPKNWVDVNNNSVNVDNNSIKVDGNTQRREEESREDNSFLPISRESAEQEPQNPVKLTDKERIDLENKISKTDLDYYLGVIKACELSGKHYIKKSHYKAILEMAKKDGKIKQEKPKAKKNMGLGNSFDSDEFFQAALQASYGNAVESKEIKEGTP
jgi:hypothetical protein